MPPNSRTPLRKYSETEPSTHIGTADRAGAKSGAGESQRLNEPSQYLYQQLESECNIAQEDRQALHVQSLVVKVTRHFP